MAQILKLTEWQDPTKYWHVADVHTWTGWRECADVLGAESFEDYLNILIVRYKANVRKIVEYDDKQTLIIFNWAPENYKNAHQFKLDVNRIARKKNYLVERSF